VIHCDWSCYSNGIGILCLNLWSYRLTVIWTIWAFAGVGVTYHAYWIWYFNWDWSRFGYFMVDHKKKTPRAAANVDFLEWWALLLHRWRNFKENDDCHATSIQCWLICERHLLVCSFDGLLISGILDYLEGFQDTHLHQVVRLLLSSWHSNACIKRLYGYPCSSWMKILLTNIFHPQVRLVPAIFVSIFSFPVWPVLYLWHINYR